MTKPTPAEQVAALAVLREFALIIHGVANPTDGELEVMNAINTLDNADLFTGLDEARDELEALREERVGLPELKPGETVRPAFSDTHPRAARELGETIRPEGDA